MTQIMSSKKKNLVKQVYIVAYKNEIVKITIKTLLHNHIYLFRS